MYKHKSKMYLRKIEASDAVSGLLELKREWFGTHNCLIINSDDQIKWYNSIPSNQLYLIGEWSNVPVGVAVFTDIDHTNRSLKISGSVYKEHRKSEIIKAGFAAGLDFAFEMLNMHRIEAEVIEYNIPAQQIEIDYLGFIVEGRKRKSVYKCGKYYDSLVLGMLREDWEQQPRVKDLGDSCNENFSHATAERLLLRSKLMSI